MPVWVARDLTDGELYTYTLKPIKNKNGNFSGRDGNVSCQLNRANFPQIGDGGCVQAFITLNVPKLDRAQIRNIEGAAKRQYELNPHLRLGQCYFNEAIARHPEFEYTRGSDVDPFYRDDRIEKFLKELGE